MASKLLPCPFCGSEPMWINETLADSHYYIKCPTCQIIMKADRRDKAIGLWNTRSTCKTNTMSKELILVNLQPERDAVIKKMMGILPIGSGVTVQNMTRSMLEGDITKMQGIAIEEFCKYHDLCPVCITGGWTCTSDHQ